MLPFLAYNIVVCSNARGKVETRVSWGTNCTYDYSGNYKVRKRVFIGDDILKMHACFNMPENVPF